MEMEVFKPVAMMLVAKRHGGEREREREREREVLLAAKTG
jgi:hypothetical protein